MWLRRAAPVVEVPKNDGRVERRAVYRDVLDRTDEWKQRTCHRAGRLRPPRHVGSARANPYRLGRVRRVGDIGDLDLRSAVHKESQRLAGTVIRERQVLDRPQRNRKLAAVGKGECATAVADDSAPLI